MCIDPSIVIEVNGSVCCFFIVYVIPFYFRLRHQNKSQGDSKVSNNTDESYLLNGELSEAD